MVEPATLVHAVMVCALAIWTGRWIAPMATSRLTNKRLARLRLVSEKRRASALSIIQAEKRRLPMLTVVRFTFSRPSKSDALNRGTCYSQNS